jgi:hypothetical protein
MSEEIPMRALVPFVAVALFACGGTDATSVGSESLAGPGAPPFASDPLPTATPPAPPAVCTVCTETADCGIDAVCVAFTRGTFCAAECTKEGFCPAGQRCESGGAFGRACVRNDAACGEPRAPRLGATTRAVSD